MSTPYIRTQDCSVSEFEKQCTRRLEQSHAPNAADIVNNIPIYVADNLVFNEDLLAEWAYIFRNSAGVIAIKNACPDHYALNEATRLYEKIIAEERVMNAGSGDHFAAAGANDRIWNSLQKLALKAPDIFARYFANPAIDAAARAWLGEGYQMTAQVNLVRPGGKAQQAHRDYHLGFMGIDQAARFPAHVHELSPVMTLQGAIAHIDAPIEAGPTKLLPFSQNYREGYIAYHLPEFADYFEANYVQLPLEKGDAIFFNPAVFHAAGDNNSHNIHRFVNLLQMSSPMGRAMENLDRLAMCKAVYPALLALEFDQAKRDAVISSTAEGYSFPTNLDRDPPIGGLAPKTQADIMRDALIAGKSAKEFNEEIDALANRQKA